MQDLAFRRLAAEDLPLLQSWLAEGPALHWYSHDRAPGLAEVEREYLPRIRGEEPISLWILLRDGHPAGFFQTYRLHDYPDYPIAGETGDAALDYLLAPFEIGHGLAAPALQAFLREVVFTAPDVLRCYADPHPGNTASVRALRRAGFQPCASPGRDVLLLCHPAPIPDPQS